jgi:hypothetical protein
LIRCTLDPRIHHVARIHHVKSDKKDGIWSFAPDRAANGRVRSGADVW